MKGDFDNFESRIKYYPKNYFRYKEELTLLQVHNHF